MRTDSVFRERSLRQSMTRLFFIFFAFAMTAGVGATGTGRRATAMYLLSNEEFSQLGKRSSFRC